MSAYIRGFLGIVLVAAGSLKGLDVFSSTNSSNGAVGLLIISQVGIEIGLGVWLVVGWFPKQAHISAWAAFTVLSLVAGFKVIRGESSCQCAGDLIRINPWFAFVFDLGAIGCLLRWPATGNGVWTIPSTALGFFTLAVFALATSALSAFELVGGWTIGTIVVRGPSRLTIAHPDRTKPLEARFRLHNPTSRNISVNHINTGCPRVSAEMENWTILPGQEQSVIVRVGSFEEASSSFLYRIRIETDSGNANFVVTGNVPVAQTIFYRPQLLIVEKDKDGKWAERIVRIRLPKSCVTGLSREDVVIKDCLDSKAFLTSEQATSDHLEYCLRIALSAKITKKWQGGSIEVRTQCGILTIPVSIATGTP